MIPVHLSTSIPSTSHPNGKPEMIPRPIGVPGGETVRYVYPMPMVGTVPVRIRVRPPISTNDGVKFESITVGPRSNLIDPRRLTSRPNTVAARKRRAPLRPPIFDIIQPSSEAKTEAQQQEQKNPSDQNSEEKVASSNQTPRSCVSSSRVPSRTPSRASQRSVTFSLHTPSRHESTYEESSQFNPAQIDTVSISARKNSQSRASQVNGSNAGGTIMLYNQQPHSMVPGAFVAPYEGIPVPPPIPFWYPAPPPPPFYAPPPMDAKTMRSIMKKAMEAEKRYQSKYKPSGCQQFCCGGAASLFWILLFLIILAAIAVLIVALIYI